MKMTMEKIYWQSHRGTCDFMFEMYFKHTNPAKFNKKYGNKTKA